MLQINDKSVKSKLSTIINQMREASGLKEIQHIKKIKGTKNYYRIRICNYRLGIIVDSNQVELIRLFTERIFIITSHK